MVFLKCDFGRRGCYSNYQKDGLHLVTAPYTVRTLEPAPFDVKKGWSAWQDVDGPFLFACKEDGDSSGMWKCQWAVCKTDGCLERGEGKLVAKCSDTFCPL